MKVLVIGGGNMGFAFAKSFVEQEIIHSEHMMFVEKSETRVEYIEATNIGTVVKADDPLIYAAKVIVLAIKPQQADEVLAALKPFTNEEQIVISVMAGYPIHKISSAINTTKVVRVMPNLPLLVGKGILGYTYAENGGFEYEEKELVVSLLGATGEIVEVENEDKIDAVTSVSGSGPAYVYYFLKHMVEGGIKNGLDKEQAEKLALSTFDGAVESFRKNDFSFDEWIAMVSSKGGTTAAAINTFKAEQVGEKIEKGVKAAYDRAKELGA